MFAGVIFSTFIAVSLQDALQQYTTPSGHITSPDYPSHYPNNYNMDYSIIPPSSVKLIKLTLETLDLEKGFDTLEIQESVHGPQLRSLTGHASPGIEFTAPSFYLTFHTDGSNEDKGFSLTWEAVQRSYTTPSGHITSPNYPNHYPDNYNMDYSIIPPSSVKLIKLTVETLDLENINDYLQIKESVNGPPLLNLTGHALPGIELTAPTFYLVFHTDGSRGDKGFSLTWKAVYPSDCINVTCLDNRFVVDVNISSLRDLYPDTAPDHIEVGDVCSGSILNTDILHFVVNYSECNGKIQAENGFIKISNYIVYQERDQSGLIVTGDRWEVNTECYLPGVVHPDFNMRPSVSNDHHNIMSTGNLDADIYTSGESGLWVHMAKPINATVGEKLHVKVNYPIAHGLKMVLQNCYAKPTESSPVNESYRLIAEGCPVHNSTRIVYTSDTSTQFAFEVFEFRNNVGTVYIKCDVYICLLFDNSRRCSHGCSQPHSRQQQ